MLTELTHILSPYSAAWSGWVMMALFGLAVFSEYMQPGVITQAHTSIFAQTDRTYKDAPVNFFGQLLIAFFRIGTLAMGICMCMETDAPFTFSAFATIGGLTIAILLVKMLCNTLLDYTFMISRRFIPAYGQYGDIATVMTCILFPCLLVLQYLGNPNVCRWTVGIATIVFVFLWAIRMVRNYVRCARAIVYVGLYITTLEVLPLGILYYLSSKTISIL